MSENSIGEGYFEEDSSNGWSRVIYNYGHYYIGQLKNYKRHGIGKYVSADGIVKEGRWENHKFLG